MFEGPFDVTVGLEKGKAGEDVGEKASTCMCRS